jgi:hypothetical protein
MVLLCRPVAAPGQEVLVPLRGEIIEAGTGRPLPARVYLQDSAGNWYFPKSAAAEGSAVEYRKQRQAGSVEMHTTLSAHPFSVMLPPGKYRLTVERGKEYFPAEQELTVRRQPVEVRVELRRWIEMAKRGWYSGDTHVHRTLAELPNVMLTEDLNVALPLVYWVTTADTPPASGDKSTAADPRPEVIAVDPTHAIYPINTEYEIFRVGGKPHTLGAVFVLGHRTPLDRGVPPVGPIAARARREGALLDLDKHSWPWSLMLVPVMQVDLFELANNHVWRTRFGFRQWTLDALPEYMNLEIDEEGFTEWGWIDFGFQTYYALLNCGFRLRPTAGTASGVHPVPLGFGRVYVQLPDGFSYQAWMQGLGEGRSFVTTGPMLQVEVNGQPPGHTFAGADAGASYRVTGSAESGRPLDRIEILVSGRVAKSIPPANQPTPAGGFRCPLDESIRLDGSGWIAVRCFERRPDRRVRFAHSSPVHIEVPGRPLRPRREEAAWLVQRVRQEISRNQGILSEEALQEYRQALDAYQRALDQAR